jgi:hypothetical protein
MLSKSHLRPETRPSPKLVLYGIVFRLLCGVAFHASDCAAIAEGQVPVPDLLDSRHRALRKDRSPLSLELDPGQ